MDTAQGLARQDWRQYHDNYELCVCVCVWFDTIIARRLTISENTWTRRRPGANVRRATEGDRRGIGADARSDGSGTESAIAAGGGCTALTELIAAQRR